MENKEFQFKITWIWKFSDYNKSKIFSNYSWEIFKFGCYGLLILSKNLNFMVGKISDRKKIKPNVAKNRFEKYKEKEKNLILNKNSRLFDFIWFKKKKKSRFYDFRIKRLNYFQKKRKEINL